jgi:hypothetical protein
VKASEDRAAEGGDIGILVSGDALMVGLVGADVVPGHLQSLPQSVRGPFVAGVELGRCAQSENGLGALAQLSRAGAEVVLRPVAGSSQG